MTEDNSKTPSADSKPGPVPKSAAEVLTSPPPQDPWKDRLKQKMLEDRHRLQRRTWVLVGLLVLLAAGVLWWMYPGPSLPPLMAVAFDTVSLPGEEVQVHLQLEPIQSESPFPKNLVGLKVTFVDLTKPAPPPAKTATDRYGHALATLAFTGNLTEAKFKAQFDGNRQAKANIDVAKVFFIPKDTVLVLVDVQDLLADPSVELTSKDLTQIPPYPPAIKLLQSLRAEKKHIVYLAPASERAEGYQLARRWLGIRGPALPPGPILGRPGYHDGKTVEEAERRIIAELAGRWKVTAVGRGQGRAELYRQTGVSFREIGD